MTIQTAAIMAAILFAPLPRAIAGARIDLQRDVGIDQKPGARVPMDARFLDADGRSVTLGSCFGGKPVILNLVYFECPMLCNLTQDGLMRTLRTMRLTAGREFSVLTVSFDPRETPEIAKRRRKITISAYGRPDAERGWRFLTGDRESVRRLTEAVGFRYAWDNDRGRFAHAAGIVILTPGGRVSHYLNGVEFAARDVRLALVEASDNKIGTATDQVLLFCYQYDPTTGRYGLAISNILRVSGLATVCLLVGGFFMLKRREKRRRTAAPAPPEVNDGREST